MKFIDTSCEVIPTTEIMEESFNIALAEKISFYDSLFLAASIRENVPLLTLDKRLKNTGYTVKLL
jgi:predicted nucleic acid-binding protein